MGRGCSWLNLRRSLRSWWFRLVLTRMSCMFAAMWVSLSTSWRTAVAGTLYVCMHRLMPCCFVQKWLSCKRPDNRIALTGLAKAPSLQLPPECCMHMPCYIRIQMHCPRKFAPINYDYSSKGASILAACVESWAVIWTTCMQQHRHCQYWVLHACPYGLRFCAGPH